MFEDLVVQEAREWVGTPFAFAQQVKGVACDCSGLIRGVCAKLRIPMSTFVSYGKCYQAAMVEKELAEWMDLVDEPEFGCVLSMWLRIPDEPMHLAICAGDTVIHSKLNRVVLEEPLERWADRIHSCWRFRWPQ